MATRTGHHLQSGPSPCLLKPHARGIPFLHWLGTWSSSASTAATSEVGVGSRTAHGEVFSWTLPTMAATRAGAPGLLPQYAPGPCRSADLSGLDIPSWLRCTRERSIFPSVGSPQRHCFPLVLAASAQTFHPPTQGQKHSTRAERCNGEEIPPGAVSSLSYLLLLWVIEGGGGVQHSFLGIVEELRDVLEVLGRTLGIQRKRQPCKRGRAMGW